MNVSYIKYLILTVIVIPITYITVNWISDIYSEINCKKVDVGTNNILCMDDLWKNILQIMNIVDFNKSNTEVKIWDYMWKEDNFTEINYYKNGLEENENLNFLSLFNDKEKDALRKWIRIASENNFFTLKFLSVRFASDKNYDYFKGKIIENRNNGKYLYNYSSLLDDNNERQKYNDILLFLKYQNIKSVWYKILKDGLSNIYSGSIKNIETKNTKETPKENFLSKNKDFGEYFKDKKVVELLNKWLVYNNPDVIWIRWSKPYNDNYETISKNINNYSQDWDIAFFMICFFHWDEDCKTYSKWIEKVQSNINIYLEWEKKKTVKKEEKKNETGKLWVTSYNPECNQTKGWVKWADWLCRAKEYSPCAVWSNRWKTEWLCWNPCIWATWVDLCKLVEEWERPIAVGQDMKHLKWKKVIAQCFKNWKPFEDERCNWEFIVLDHKHERFSQTVDIFFMNRKDNIGQVDMVLTEVKSPL